MLGSGRACPSSRKQGTGHAADCSNERKRVGVPQKLRLLMQVECLLAASSVIDLAVAGSCQSVQNSEEPAFCNCIRTKTCSVLRFQPPNSSAITTPTAACPVQIPVFLQVPPFAAVTSGTVTRVSSKTAT